MGADRDVTAGLRRHRAAGPAARRRPGPDQRAGAGHGGEHERARPHRAERARRQPAPAAPARGAPRRHRRGGRLRRRAALRAVRARGAEHRDRARRPPRPLHARCRALRRTTSAQGRLIPRAPARAPACGRPCYRVVLRATTPQPRGAPARLAFTVCRRQLRGRHRRRPCAAARGLAFGARDDRRATSAARRRVRCREWPRSTPGSARWARAWSTTASSSSARGRRRRSASPSACAAPTTSWPTRATACAARGSPAERRRRLLARARRPALPDPASRWQPEGLRGPVARRRPRRVRVDRPRLPRRAAARRRALRAARRHVHRRGHLRGGRRAPAGAGRARRHPRRAHAGRRVPRPPRLGLRRRLPLRRALGLRRPARPGSASSTPPTPRAWASILDVVYNHVGACGVKALEAFGPYFTERYETPWGKAINFDDAGSDAVREWVLQSATGWVRDFHVDGLRLDAIHAIYDDGARHVLRRAGRARPRRRPPRAGHRRERPQRPEGHPPAAPGRLRPRRRVGRRLPPRPARAAHRRARGLVRGVRPAWRSWPRPSTARTSTTATTRPSAAGASARRADDRPPEQFVVFAQNHDQVGNRAFGDRLPARGAAAGRVLHAAVTLHADAVHGRGARRARAVPVLLRPHRQADRRRDPRGPPRGVRRLRRVRRRGGARPAGPGDLRALQAHAPRRARSCARCTPRCCARAARCRRACDSIEFSEDDGWLRVRRGAFELACNFAGGPRGRCRSTGRTVALATARARPWATAACACPRARER